MIYNIESLYLKLNDGLKGAVKARDEHIDSLIQAMQLLEHKHEPSSTPFPVVEILKRIPPCLSFLRPSQGVPEPSQKSRQIEPPHHEKYPHTTQIKILQITPYYQLVGFY